MSREIEWFHSQIFHKKYLLLGVSVDPWVVKIQTILRIEFKNTTDTVVSMKVNDES